MTNGAEGRKQADVELPSNETGAVRKFASVPCNASIF